MINTDNVLEKGIYNHQQPSGYIVARNYLVLEEEGKRYLLIRFANESNVKITAFKFVLSQLDSNGKVICSSKITYDEVCLEPHATLSEKRGIRVKEECVDFYIKVISFVSELYRYEYKKGQLVVHYDVRSRLNTEKIEHEKVEVRSQKKSYARFHTVIAFAALLFLALVCVLARFEAENGSFEFLSAANEITEWNI